VCTFLRFALEIISSNLLNGEISTNLFVVFANAHDINICK
jgi:hypothetical protein